MKALGIFAALIGLLSVTALAHAEEAGGRVTASTDVRGELRTMEYAIGPEDVLSIRVYDEEDLTKEAIVTQEGQISFPLLGTVSVNGKTTAEVERLMSKRLEERFLVNPQVFVSVKEYNSRRAVVLGMVKEPGSYSLTGQTTILDLVSRAGGLLEESGKNLVLIRNGNRGDVRQNRRVAREASARPAAAMAADVSADFEDASSDARRRPESILAGVDYADGISTPILIDSNKLLRLGDSSLNHVVRDDDILFIPKTDGVYVYGEVKKPGVVGFRDGLTVLQAVSLAEGLTSHAAESKVQVIRSVEGGQRKIKVDLEDVADNEADDLVLQPEDIIVVPESWL